MLIIHASYSASVDVYFLCRFLSLAKTKNNDSFLIYSPKLMTLFHGTQKENFHLALVTE